MISVALILGSLQDTSGLQTELRAQVDEVLSGISRSLGSALADPIDCYLLTSGEASSPVTDELVAKSKAYYLRNGGDSDAGRNPLFAAEGPWNDYVVPIRTSIVSRSGGQISEVVLSPEIEAGGGTMWLPEKEAVFQYLTAYSEDNGRMVPTRNAYVFRLEEGGATDLAATSYPALADALRFCRGALSAGGAVGRRVSNGAVEWELIWDSTALGRNPHGLALHLCYPWIGGAVSAVIRERVSPTSGRTHYDLSLFQRDVAGRLLSETQYMGISDRLQFLTMRSVHYFPGIAQSFSERWISIVPVDQSLAPMAALTISGGARVTDWRLSGFEWVYLFDGEIPGLAEVIDAKRVAEDAAREDSGGSREEY